MKKAAVAAATLAAVAVLPGVASAKTYTSYAGDPAARPDTATRLPSRANIDFVTTPLLDASRAQCRGRFASAQAQRHAAGRVARFGATPRYAGGLAPLEDRLSEDHARAEFERALEDLLDRLERELDG